MMDFITAPLVVGFICLGIYALFELFVRRKERLLIMRRSVKEWILLIWEKG